MDKSKLTTEANGRQKFLHKHPTLIDAQRKSSYIIRHTGKSIPKMKLTSNDKSSDFRSISSPRLKYFPAEEKRRVLRSPRQPNVFPFPAGLSAPSALGNNFMSCQGDSIPQPLPQPDSRNHNQTLSQPVLTHPILNEPQHSEVNLNANSIQRPPDRQTHRPFVPNPVRNLNPKLHVNSEHPTVQLSTNEDDVGTTQLPYKGNYQCQKESHRSNDADDPSDLEKQPVGGRNAALHRIAQLAKKKQAVKLSPPILPQPPILYQPRENPEFYPQPQQQMQRPELYYDSHHKRQPIVRNAPPVGMTSPQDLIVNHGRSYGAEPYQLPVQAVVSPNVMTPQTTLLKNTRFHQDNQDTRNIPGNNLCSTTSPSFQQHPPLQEYPPRRTVTNQRIERKKLQFTPAMIRDQELLVKTMRQQEIPEDLMRRQFDTLLHHQKQQLMYDARLEQEQADEEEYYYVDQHGHRKATKIVEDGKPEWMLHITPPWIPYASAEKMLNTTSKEGKKSVRIIESPHQQWEQQQYQGYNCLPNSHHRAILYQDDPRHYQQVNNNGDQHDNIHHQPNYNPSPHFPQNPTSISPTSILKRRNDHDTRIMQKPQVNNGLQDLETVSRTMEELKNVQNQEGFQYLMNLNAKEPRAQLNGIQNPDDPAVQNFVTQLMPIDMKKDVKKEASANGLENTRNPNNPPPPPSKLHSINKDELMREYPRQRVYNNNGDSHVMTMENHSNIMADPMINGYQNNSSAFQNSTVDGNARYKNSVQDQVVYQDKGGIAGHYNHGIPYNLVRSNSLPPNMYSQYQPVRISQCVRVPNGIYNDQIINMKPSQIHREKYVQPNLQMPTGIHIPQQYLEAKVIGGIRYLARKTECEPHLGAYGSTISNNVPSQPIAYY